MSSNQVAVVGAGTMGAGIAQVAALRGWTVRLIDADAASLDRAIAGLQKQFARQAETGRISAEQRDASLHRIQAAKSINDVHDVVLAIEAVVEDLGVKQQVFRALESAADGQAVLATNTSSLSITRIAQAVSDPSRVIGMHFFNPAPVMPLVEIIAGRESSTRSLDFGTNVAREWGKVTVAATDTPGFIVNRVARGYYLEALRMLGEGVAGIDETDSVMRRHGGFKMGPFELMDLVGLDVNLAVSTSVWEQMGRPNRFQPHPIQQRLVSEGRLGRKSSRGFYVYESDRQVPALSVRRKTFELSPLVQDAVRAFATGAGAVDSTSTEQYVLTRILAAVLNEASMALAEGVANAEDIDLAMQKGTNYPKGPLAWADSIGPRTVRGVLSAFDRMFADGRYDPGSRFAY